MEVITTLINFILHIDSHLINIVNQYGTLTYIILFTIVFMETGFVITPFLPGDSLLFAAGAISAGQSLNILFVWLVFFLAAITGDSVNYWLGRFLGSKVFLKYPQLFKKAYLQRAQMFYKKHGEKTVVLARFIPIIRTFAPFVAGIAHMRYGKFLIYSIFGGFIWVTIFTSAGYLFGNIPFVKNNFHYMVLAIIVISLLPIIHDRLSSKKV